MVTQTDLLVNVLEFSLAIYGRFLYPIYNGSGSISIKMAFAVSEPYDPTQEQYQQAPVMQQQQQQSEPFTQQGGFEGSSGSAGGDTKTTLW